MFHKSRHILAAIGFLLTAISAAWGANLRVGFIDPQEPPAFWDQVDETMRAAAELGIDVDIRSAEHSHDKAIALARAFLREKPSVDFLIACNNFDVGGEIIRMADAAHVRMIFIDNPLERKDWAEYGEPRSKYKSWLGSIVPDHEGAGYGIGTAILTTAARLKTARPLRVLALTGETDNPAAVERLRGLKRAIADMNKLLGPGSVELAGVRYLDWSAKTAEAAVLQFTQTEPHIDALWAANDPMALGAIAALRERSYRPGTDVLVGGLNWSKAAIKAVRDGDMVATYGGHFLLGAWVMVVLRDYNDGRDFAEEDLELQVAMSAIDLPIARRFPNIADTD